METARPDWIEVLPAADIPEAKPIRVNVQGSDILLFRRGDRLFAISNVCTHQGAPLHRGRVSGSGEQLAVTCPVHGSIFRLLDGRVMRGPAMVPAAAYEARIAGDRAEVRARRNPVAMW